MCHRGTFAKTNKKKNKKKKNSQTPGEAVTQGLKEKIIKLIHNKQIEIPVYFFVLLCDLQF